MSKVLLLYVESISFILFYLKINFRTESFLSFFTSNMHSFSTTSRRKNLIHFGVYIHTNPKNSRKRSQRSEKSSLIVFLLRNEETAEDQKTTLTHNRVLHININSGSLTIKGRPLCFQPEIWNTSRIFEKQKRKNLFIGLNAVGKKGGNGANDYWTLVCKNH